MQTTERNIADMFQAIDELDFTRIKAKLMHKQDGVIALRKIERAEAGYRQFLKLAAKYPDAPIVPSKEVDEFWHMHILDTQRYSADCERIFGYMIHHDPYSGIEGGDDEARHLALAAASDAMSLREFGEGEVGAYCVKAVAGRDEQAYCVKAVAGRDEQAYCVKAVVGRDEQAYCVKAVAGRDEQAYCVKAVAGRDEQAYCVKALVGRDGQAYCVKAVAGRNSQAYCVKPQAKGDSSAYCVKPEAKAIAAAYCVRPMAAPAPASSALRHAA
jgi:hypothetical protein